MSVNSASTTESQWPPEVPPYRRPGPPLEPPGPQPPMPAPVPILPSWEEPEPTMTDDVMDRLLRQRIIMLGGHLDDAAADRASAQLLLLGRRDSAPIELHLTCPRSELDASLALADTADLLVSPVHVVVRGTIAGPAAAVLCAATRRIAHRHATVVLSVPRSSASGTSDELAAAAEEYQRQVMRLQQRIAEVSGKPVDEVAADLDRRLLLTAAEAVEYGLLDELL
jgi:ATP-dependent Clp protease protease subunit